MRYFFLSLSIIFSLHQGSIFQLTETIQFNSLYNSGALNIFVITVSLWCWYWISLPNQWIFWIFHTFHEYLEATMLLFNLLKCSHVKVKLTNSNYFLNFRNNFHLLYPNWRKSKSHFDKYMAVFHIHYHNFTLQFHSKYCLKFAAFHFRDF